MTTVTSDAGRPFGPLPDRARAALASVWAGLAFSVAWIPVNIAGAVTSRRVADAAPGARSTFATFEDVELWLGLAGLLVTAVSVALCLRWLLVAVRLVEALTGMPPKHSPRWAAWSWFVPVVWWVVPFRVVRELWRSGDRRRDGPVGPVVGWWWALWLGTWATTLVSGALWTAAAEDVERYTTVYAVDLVLLPVSIGASVLSIVVIRAITARQLAALSG